MKKPVIIVSAVIIATLITIGGYQVVKSLFTEKPQTIPEETPIVENINSLPQDAIEADVSPRFDKKTAIIKVTRLPVDVKKVDFELTYTADLKDMSNATRGSNGTISNPDASGFLKEVTLGTCSKNVCTYEKNPRDFKLKLILTFKDGSKSSWQKDFPGN